MGINVIIVLVLLQVAQTIPTILTANNFRGPALMLDIHGSVKIATRLAESVHHKIKNDLGTNIIIIMIIFELHLSF